VTNPTYGQVVQMFGEIQLKAGVVDALCRSWYSPLPESKRLAMCVEIQSPESRTESNQGKGKCLGTY
jgi:hypothetical protein